MRFQAEKNKQDKTKTKDKRIKRDIVKGTLVVVVVVVVVVAAAAAAAEAAAV